MVLSKNMYLLMKILLLEESIIRNLEKKIGVLLVFIPLQIDGYQITEI